VDASLKDLADTSEGGTVCVRVTVIEARGSTPREAGAAMVVFTDQQTGTIGGGALEFDAAAHAQKMLGAEPFLWLRDVKAYPLGPSLGQCCGGHVRLLFERFGDAELRHISALIQSGASYLARPVMSGAPLVDPATYSDAAFAGRENLRCKMVQLSGAKEEWFVERVATTKFLVYLYGAGHVAREIVRVLAGTDAEIIWIDTDISRFPAVIPSHAKRLVAAAPHSAVNYAPEDAFHVVMTYSHAMDLDICHSVLKHGAFRYLGLIGSQTKRERFARRLCELGIEESFLNRLTCPIGADGPSGKQPAVIAIAVAAEILRLNESGGS
jgi:xanthine dehydrogenase accessory factor